MYRAWIVAGLAICQIMPMPAHADVMEIGRSGAIWVAGGPAAPLDAEASSISGTPYSDKGVQTSVRENSNVPPEWRFRVAELAQKYDLSPKLIEALVWQESRWNTMALSPVGARGLTQLMPGTARMLGVNASDPHANLEGGARYLRMQLDAFDGDVLLALAAYNAGPQRVIKAGGIPAIRETRNYVATILSRLSQSVH
ncbi:MAG: lytic transglycosylase domain-containing protein [Novosphingobium sp.]